MHGGLEILLLTVSTCTCSAVSPDTRHADTMQCTGFPQFSTWYQSALHPHEAARRCAQEYYRAMEGALAVLPAFASPAYLTHKASSSVAAAIICGTPLLADEALLRAYSYLPAHAVFETAAGEHDESAMAHVAAHSQEAGPSSCYTCCCYTKDCEQLW